MSTLLCTIESNLDLGQGDRMEKIKQLTRAFVQDESGATLLEYGMLVLLIAVLCIAAIKSIGTKISAGFTTVDSNLP